MIFSIITTTTTMVNLFLSRHFSCGVFLTHFKGNHYKFIQLNLQCLIKLENSILTLTMSEYQPPRHYFILLTYGSVDRDAWVDKQSTFFHPYLQGRKKWIDFHVDAEKSQNLDLFVLQYQQKIGNSSVVDLTNILRLAFSTAIEQY